MAIYSLRLTPIGKTTQAKPYTASAHVRYITRAAAATHVMAERMPEGKTAAQRWLRAEEKADRSYARVADKLVIALPRELSRQQQITLVHAFAERLTQSKASWFAAIHAKGKDQENPHCHLLVRDRDVSTGKRVVMFSAGTKERLQRARKGEPLPTTLNDIRALWEQHANAALQQAGHAERVDRRSLATQGIGRPAQVHEGPNIRAMHQRGFRPPSKQRVVRNGPTRQQGQQPTRTINYPAIDQGRTRVEYNSALRNLARADGVAQLLENRQRASTAWRQSQTAAVAARQALPVQVLPLATPAPDRPIANGPTSAATAPQRAPEPLSLTERLIRDLGTPLATPVDNRDRQRPRSR